MINIIKNLKSNEGLTLKNGQPINYKSGYQVATEGIETANPQKAIQAIRNYKGNCGIWFNEGKYYVDKCQRVSNKAQAIEIGKAHNQLSIFKWSDKSLIWC